VGEGLVEASRWNEVQAVGIKKAVRGWFVEHNQGGQECNLEEGVVRIEGDFESCCQFVSCRG